MIVSLGFFYLLYCAVVLYRSAEKARQRAMNRLLRNRIHAEGVEENEKLVQQITIIRDEIASIRKGAFVPFFEQPWIRAVLIFLGSGGGLLFLQNSLWPR